MMIASRLEVSLRASIPAVLAALSACTPQTSAASQALDSGSVVVDGLRVSYPDGWSSARGAGVTRLVNVAPDKLPTLDAAGLERTAQIIITVEQRTDHEEAVQRLHEIAAEASDTPRYLTIAGWPAMQRRHLGPREQPGGARGAPSPALLTITTAIAAGDDLVRLEGRMPANTSQAIIGQVATLETSVERNR